MIDINSDILKDQDRSLLLKPLYTPLSALEFFISRLLDMDFEQEIIDVKWTMFLSITWETFVMQSYKSTWRDLTNWFTRG